MSTRCACAPERKQRMTAKAREVVETLIGS